MEFANYDQQSGLQRIDDTSYYYSDRFGKVLFKSVETKGIEGNTFSRITLPFLAIFTGPPDNNIHDNYFYVGDASKHYRFVGNEQLINNTLELLTNDLNIQIQREETDNKYATLFYNVALTNSHNIPEVGDVFPVFTIKNSYNKKITEKISYGFGIYDEGRFYSYSSARLFGEFTRRHMNNSQVRDRNLILGGIENLGTQIPFICEESANFYVNTEEIMAIIDTVEALGKKRHKALVELIQSFDENNITAWKIFVAMMKFISQENNFNAKRVLESVAERMLLLPTRIAEAFGG